MKRAVLAYSGGLDTSVAIHWLRDKGYEVHAVAVDAGQKEDFAGIVERGRVAGAADVRVVDVVDRFAADYLTRAIKATLDNIDRNHATLGRHLRSTIRTGRYCSYTPDPRAPIAWES